MIYLIKHSLCIRHFWQYMKSIAYVILCAAIVGLLQYFNNISDRFLNILAIFQYFQGSFLQYVPNISLLCGSVSEIFCNHTARKILIRIDREVKISERKTVCANEVTLNIKPRSFGIPFCLGHLCPAQSSIYFRVCSRWQKFCGLSALLD